MADVFVSYKKEDRARARTVVDALQAAGYSVWWDDDLTPRTAWDIEIEIQLLAARAVVVLWSSKAAAIVDTPRGPEGTFVRKEAAFALERGNYTPAWIEKCELPLSFRDRQTADIISFDGAPRHPGWEILLRWVGALVGREACSHAAPKLAPPAVVHRPLDSLGSADFWADIHALSASGASTTSMAFEDVGVAKFLRRYPELEDGMGFVSWDRVSRVRPWNVQVAFAVHTYFYFREHLRDHRDAAVTALDQLDSRSSHATMRELQLSAMGRPDKLLRWSEILAAASKSSDAMTGTFIAANLQAFPSIRRSYVECGGRQIASASSYLQAELETILVRDTPQRDHWVAELRRAQAFKI